MLSQTFGIGHWNSSMRTSIRSPFRFRSVVIRAAKESARIEETSHQVLGYDQLHSRCYESLLPVKQFSLGLLSVCRQICHEAVLVPFTDNTFIDDVRVDGPHLRIFLDRLVPIQVKSINYLVLNTTQMSLHRASDLNRLSGLKTSEYNLVHRRLRHTSRQEFIDFYEKDLKTLHPDKLRLPELAHMSVNALEWQRRASTFSHDLQQIKEWFGQVMSARQEVRLAHNRAGVTRRKAQQIRKLAHRSEITPQMIQCANKLKLGTAWSRQELHDITMWVKSVETRMLKALRLPPRGLNAATAA